MENSKSWNSSANLEDTTYTVRHISKLFHRGRTPLLNSFIQMVSLSTSTYKTKVCTFGLGKMSMSGFTPRKVQVRGVLGLKALQAITVQEDEGSTQTWSDLKIKTRLNLFYLLHHNRYERKPLHLCSLD